MKLEEYKLLVQLSGNHFSLEIFARTNIGLWQIFNENFSLKEQKLIYPELIIQIDNSRGDDWKVWEPNQRPNE